MKRATRRRFLTAAASVSVAGCAWRSPGAPPLPRIFFTSQGKTGVMNADGGGLRYLEFDVPNQATWQPVGFFPDGRVLMLSMEPRRDGPGRPFDEYYTQTPTHIWIYDLETEALTEIATKDRLAPFETPQLLIGETRMLQDHSTSPSPSRCALSRVAAWWSPSSARRE